MNQISSHNLSSNNCSQCGAPLILTSKVTVEVEGSRFPETISTFICSDAECQARKDKEESKRMKLKEEKTESDRVRKEKKISDKAALQASLQAK